MPLRDLPGYYPEILDGGLGVLPPSLSGLFGVVGVSRKGSTNIKFAVDPDDVEEEYGQGSMVEHLLDAFANKARQIGIRRCVADIVGSVSSVTHKEYGGAGNGGQASVTAAANISGVAPYNDRKFIIRITAGGSLSDARYILSRNNGITWEPEAKFVVTDSSNRKSKMDMGNGSYIEFTEYSSTPDDSFVTGDEYRWSTTEDKASVNNILDAVQDLIDWVDPNGGQGFEYIYVAAEYPGTRSQFSSFLASLSTAANTLWSQESRPIWIMLNAPQMADDGSETVDAWISDLVNISANNRKLRLSVNAGAALLTDPHGETQVRPIGACLAGLVSAAKLHHSVGWVRYMSIPNSVSVYPYHPIRNISSETVGAGDGTKQSFTKVLDNRSLKPWTVSVTSDDSSPETFTDNGDGTLTGSAGGTGSVDYETGKITVNFNTAPASGKTVTASYTYTTNVEMDKGKLAQLNDARYVTLRNWIGYGRIATDDWMFASATSDFYCIRNRRIVDEAVRMVGIANVPYINSPGITQKDMAAYKADLSRPLEAMKVTEENTDKPIMDYKLTLRPDENIWSNGIVHCKVEIVPTPTKKKLEATFQLKTKIEE